MDQHESREPANGKCNKSRRRGAQKASPPCCYFLLTKNNHVNVNEGGLVEAFLR